MVIGLLSFSIPKSVFIINVEKTKLGGGCFFSFGGLNFFLEQNWIYSFEN